MRWNRAALCFGILAITSLVALFQRPVAAQRGTPRSDVESRRQMLNALVAAEWEFELRDSPESASRYGDYRFNNKLDDRSMAHVQLTRKALADFLAQLSAIDSTGFSEAEQLNKTLLIGRLTLRLEEIDLKNYEMPIDQFYGDHLWFPQMFNYMPLDSTKHFDDYLSRLLQIPSAIDQIIARLQQGEKDGLMPPKILLEKVVTQCGEIEVPSGETSVFATPLKKFPVSIPETEQKRLHVSIVAAIDSKVRPAYLKLEKFLREDYAPKGRKDPGLWALPQGDARYRAAVRATTTTDMTPEQIHQLGLAQLKEIEGQMDVLARQQGSMDWKAYRTVLYNDPKLLATSREQILESYREYLAAVRPKLPQFFGTLPKAIVVVVPVEEYREKQAAPASYALGTPDGSRPGRIMVNTGDFQHRLLPRSENSAYHEGIPGHHLQVSIQQEVWDLPAFRQHSLYTAYVEGWGLYAERLGKELGMFQGPPNEFHRLASEQFRATRLVLDTGVHYKRWTREQVVTFFHEHSIEPETQIQAETDRYIALPAQALSYKIGQLKILELRKGAQDQLGDKFDIRAFHDKVLSGGSLPLDVLDAQINDWISKVKAGTLPKKGD